MMAQLHDLLREHSDGIPFDDVIERQALDRSRLSLRAATAVEQPPARPRRTGRYLGRVALVVGMAAVIAVVVAFLPGATAVNRLGPPNASARSLLDRAARAISAEVWQPLGAGDYFHFREVGSFPVRNGAAPDRPTLVQEGWFGGNGFARLVQTGPQTAVPGGDVLIFDATPGQFQAERLRQRNGAHLKILAYPQKYRWVDLDYEQLIHLPTDASGLQRFIERHATGGGPRFSDIFSYAEALLGGGGSGGAPLPPKVTAAFYRVIARLPNMRLIGPTRDPLGRPGVAVGLSFAHQPGRIELIFNPATGVLLGERSISLNARETGAARGAVIGWSAIESQGVLRSDH